MAVPNITLSAPGAQTRSLAASATTLRIAWCVEGACVGIGLALAVIVGIEAGGVWIGIMAGAPFAAAAVVELARIPLVRSFFLVHGWFWRTLAVAGVLIAGALTAENLGFGFERAFTVRIEAVRLKTKVADDARAEAARLDGQQKRLVAQRDAVQQNLTAVIAQERDAAIASGQDADRTREAARQTAGVLGGQLDSAERERTALLTRHGKEQAGMTAVCRTAPEHCTLAALQRRQRQELAAPDQAVAAARQALQRRDEAEQQQQSAVRGQLTADLRDLRARRATLEGDLDELNREIDTVGSMEAAAVLAADRAVEDANAARGMSQMHRLAKFFFGAEDNAAAMRVLTWFSIIAACVLATAGAILAALHFRALSQPAPEAGPNRLAHALRGWIARQRRRHSVVRTVEVVREVPVPVDRVVERPVEVIRPELVLVPVPLEATEDERRQAMAHAARINREREPVGPRIMQDA
jgi:hypothetical protein